MDKDFFGVNKDFFGVNKDFFGVNKDFFYNVFYVILILNKDIIFSNFIDYLYEITDGHITECKTCYRKS